MVTLKTRRYTRIGEDAVTQKSTAGDLMEIKDLLPLIGVVTGVVLGWFLTQLAQWSATRREEKKAIAHVLSELLEIRHRLLALSKAIEFLSQHFSIPPESQMAIKTVFEQIFPSDIDLVKRYGEVVSLVAACNPILGFRLRSQDAVSPFLNKFRLMALADSPAVITLASKMEQDFMKHLESHFEQLISEVAWMHGYITWWRVRGLLKRPTKMPESFVHLLKSEIPKTASPALTNGES